MTVERLHAERTEIARYLNTALLAMPGMLLMVLWALYSLNGGSWWSIHQDPLWHQVARAASACVVLAALWSVAQIPTGTHCAAMFRMDTWQGALVFRGWLVAWVGVWLLLPSWGALKVFGGIAFFCLLVTQLHSARSLRMWRSLLVVASLLLAAGVMWAWTHPFSWGRLAHVPGLTQPEIHGVHYQWHVVQRTLESIAIWGQSAQHWPSALERTIGVDLLALGHQWGQVIMVWSGFLSVVVWLALGLWWLSASDKVSTTQRRLALALIGMHASTALGNNLWVNAMWYQPIGHGVLPWVNHAGWWVLTSTLLVLCAGRLIDTNRQLDKPRG